MTISIGTTQILHFKKLNAFFKNKIADISRNDVFKVFKILKWQFLAQCFFEGKSIHHHLKIKYTSETTNQLRWLVFLAHAHSPLKEVNKIKGLILKLASFI